MNLNVDLRVPFKGKPETMKCKKGEKERKGILENRGSLGLHLWCVDELLSATNTIRKQRQRDQTRSSTSPSTTTCISHTHKT